MSLIRTTSSTSSGTASPPSEHDLVSAEGQNINDSDGFAGLETWEDPTPRPSSITFEDLRDAFVEASKHQMRLRPKSPSREDMMRCSQEHDRKSLVIALNVYAKLNNMQPRELELVEVKQRNLIDENGKGYVHFNFTVKKRLDGTIGLFFAEVHPDCREDDDVYLCTALEENVSGACFGCEDRAKELVHPSGGYLGGHKDVGYPFMECEVSD